MGWVSFLEDIQKRMEELDGLIEGIQSGNIAYVDENRRKVGDITKQIRVLVGNLQNSIKSLGREDSERLDELVGFKQEIKSLSHDNQWLTGELKKAQEQAARLKEACDDEKKKHRFTIQTFLKKDKNEALQYIMKLRDYL